MKAVFAHDHAFVFDKGFYHSKAGFPQTVLNRYVAAFGELNVICRQRVAPANGLGRIHSDLISFFPQRNLRSRHGLFEYGKVRLGVANVLRQADFLIARLPSTLGLVAILEARRLEVPYAIEVVGNAYESNMLHGSLIGRVVAPIEHYLTAREVQRANHVIYITERYLQSIYPTNGIEFVCPNVHIEAAGDQVLEHRLSRETANTCTLGLIGSLDVDYKGHATALQVIKRLASDGDLQVELQLVGSGSPDRWKALAETYGVASKVRFIGSLPPGERVMAWLDQVDILLQPSRTEGQGRAIIEAMSRGIPVLASNVGGIPELLDQDSMADASDVDSFANRVQLLMRSPSMYKDICKKNWFKARQFESTHVETKRSMIFHKIKATIGKAPDARVNPTGDL